MRCMFVEIVNLKYKQINENFGKARFRFMKI